MNQWLAPARRSLDTYRESADRMFDLVPSWERLATDDESREVARLLHRAVRARAGVVREWLISPLWLSGIASPSDLGDEVQNVIEADRGLAEAWAELVRGQGHQAAASAREVIDVASAAIDRSEELNMKVVEAVRVSTNGTARASEEAAATYAGVAERTVEQAGTLLTAAAEIAGTEAARLVDTSRRAAKKAVEALRLVKGNVTRDGERIFHVVGQASYEQLQTETLFATQSEAIAAGYRIARSPGGPSVKGNIGRDGTRIYHVRGQVNYDRVEAEALFNSEAEAVAEGFRPAQR